MACQGSYEHTQDKYEYEGIAKLCRLRGAVLRPAPPCDRSAAWATATASKACKFDAISGVKRACPCESGKMHRLRRLCEQACPKKVIWIRPAERRKPVVLCANHDRGALTRKACTAGLHRLHEVRKRTARPAPSR